MLSDRRPILCLVTDRRRLCAGCSDDDSRRCVIAQVREAVAAGIDLIQIRERGMEAARLADVVSQALAASRGSSTRIVVNDRLDVAMACGADGVHLRADSVPPASVRALVPAGFLVGRSVHSADEAARAAPDVDYLIAGTVFPTASKPGALRSLGDAGLAGVTHAVGVPVLAIGGITIEHLPRVAAAGAAGVAAIGLFLDEDAAAPCRSVPLHAIVTAARARFYPSTSSRSAQGLSRDDKLEAW
jgi:thiamine-phosphate pyrophosphorylase